MGAIRLDSLNNTFQFNWTYSGSLTISSLPVLSSTWNGSGPTLVNPQPPFTSQTYALGISTNPTTSTTISSGLSSFIGVSTFDLAAALSTTAGWNFTPGSNDGLEFGNFNSEAGGTLQVSYNYTPTSVPEPTTMVAGVLLLLPFGASTLRILRRKRLAVQAVS